MTVHRRLLALAGDIRRELGAGIAVGLAISACHAAQALLVAHVVAELFRGRPIAELVAWMVAVGGATVARGVLVWVGDIAAQRTAHAVQLRLRRRLFAKLLELGPGYVAQRRTGDVQSTLVDGVEALEAYFGRYLPTLVTCAIVPPVVVAYLFTLDARLAGIVAGFALLVATVPRVWDRTVARAGEARWQAYRQLNADYVDSMQGLATLKAFGASARRREELDAASRGLYAATMRQLAVSMFDTAITTFGVLAGSAAAVGLGAVLVADGDLELATLLTVLLLSRECFRPFGDLARHWHAGYQGISSSEQIADILEARPAVRSVAARRAVSSCEPRIAFDDVSFTYEGRARPALRDVSFDVATGRTLAVVGESGAGKTTLVSLLLRFFDPTGGRILLGGVDVRDLPPAQVREMIAVVAQDTYLFTGTIEDNIRLARPEADDRQVRDAARVADIDRFIASLPTGYATRVGERGLNLSGGQRQRLAIARAVLKDAPILVLDEATSHVDVAGERSVHEALRRLQAGRTTLVIAHRLTVVRDADDIVVLSQGRRVQQGRHETLLEANTEYARLVAAQAAEYT